MINHNFFHSLVLPLAADFFPPPICNFCWSHLFYMDFPFFSFCISPRQAICILSAHQPISFLLPFATFDRTFYFTWISHLPASVFLPSRQFAFYLQFWSKLGELHDFPQNVSMYFSTGQYHIFHQLSSSPSAASEKVLRRE